MAVKLLKLTDLDTRRQLAYRYPEEDKWRDPFGGDFSDEEQRQMDGVARGDFCEVFMHAGSKNQRMVTVLFTVDFG